MRKTVYIAALYLSTLLMVACASDRIPLVYQMKIPQGTIIEPDQVERLELGMTKRQVEFLLGSPAIADPFVDNRWDYVHFIKEGGRVLTHEKLTIFFEEDRVSRIESREANSQS